MRRNLPKTVSFTKVQILKEVNFGKMQLCRVEHLLLYSVITLKSEDKYVEKVFNLTELHFSEVTSFKIGTLVAIFLSKKAKRHTEFKNSIN